MNRLPRALWDWLEVLFFLLTLGMFVVISIALTVVALPFVIAGHCITTVSLVAMAWIGRNSEASRGR